MKYIDYQVSEQVAVITLNRPERLNAMVPLMRQELAKAVELANADETARAVIITGSGRGF